MMLMHTIAATALALLLFAFHRRFGKSYAHHFAMSWSAIAVGSFVETWLDSVTFVPMPLEVAANGASSAAFLVGSLWGVFGVYELTRQFTVRLRVSRITTLITLALGFTLGIVASATPIAVAVVLPAIAGFCAALSAVWTIHYRGRRGAAGIVFFAATLAGQAMVDMLSAGIALGLLKGVSSLPILYMAAHLAVGLAMMMALLDDEREAAVLAASEIEHLAYNDPLTGLSNRSLFFDRTINALAQATRQHSSIAVLFLDIDRFKNINDSLGHSFGDALLKAAANRIRDCVRPGDTVARFGGDEFTVLLPHIDKVAEASSIAYRILAALRSPFLLGGRELVVTSSIGISVYPADGLDAETLVKNADIAMYRAKEQGRDNCQLYTPELSSRALEKLDLENRLRRALDNNELMIYYQPLISVEKSTLFGFEALLRWRHPELGLLAPSQFIDAAEISGLTVPIGKWVLGSACRQARAWQLRFGVDLVVAVNLSSRQLHEPELVMHVSDALNASGLPPHLLDLEITETNAMRNAEASLKVLQQLRGIGVHISMDDFGTGYSSLSYLRRFPVDTLKLDRSFVRDIDRGDNTAISIAVIEMARALGLRVLAEGVETEQQLDFLRKHGCDLVQGFLFAEPLPEDVCWDYIGQNTVSRMSSGAIKVPRLRLKHPPAAPETRPESGTVVHHKTKSGSIRRAELNRTYAPREDFISEN